MSKILLVDDEERMLQLLKLYLHPHGFHCYSVNSGTKAIQYLKKHAVEPVLMDVMMPEKNGWETVKEIRTFSNVPIVMLTARDQFPDIISSVENGANGHLTKPINEEQLLFHIENLIEDGHNICQMNYI
ncbi:response regulator [Bacillus sp. ISL-40]|uniref:response regulator transcription factor n=1 Tax=Bacillus sp. ISL-40 TaxID=2819126 RepID=UPI001BE9372F|nr:response regulator [Bacillus sp. ISL-40]MBT2696669.1 response regulator [Bacillus sp. ISL-40]